MFPFILETSTGYYCLAQRRSNLVLCCDAFVAIVLFDEPRQNQGRGLVDHKLVKAPSNFIAGRPKEALLFWFFGIYRYSCYIQI